MKQMTMKTQQFNKKKSLSLESLCNKHETYQTFTIKISEITLIKQNQEDNMSEMNIKCCPLKTLVVLSCHQI